MLDLLKNKIFGMNKVAGLELFVGSEGLLSYNLVILERKKSLIIPVLQFVGIKSLADLKAQIPDNIPIALVVNGKGVLMKKADKGLDNKDLFEKVLPHAKFEDFYCSVLEGNQKFIFLARKEKVNEYLIELEQQALAVVDISSGIACLEAILPFVESENTQLSTSVYKIDFQNKTAQEITLQDFLDTKSTIKIGDEVVPEVLLPAFGAAFALLAKQTSSDEQDVLERFHNWKEKVVFQRIGKVSLIFFASILFLNLTLFFYLSGENSDLSVQNSSVLGDIKKIESMQHELQEKEKFLREAGWLNKSRTSFYADKIAASVPKTILLSKLEINPSDVSQSRKEKKMIFNTGSILISGTCNDPVVLNPWLKELKNFDWVKNVSSRNYQYDHKKHTGLFELEIQVLD